MSSWNWNGARWWKFDFHTHTPASEDYGKGPDQQQLRARTPREWLLDYMGGGIDCVAVTDHNSGAWIDRLKETLDELRRDKPQGFRDLHLFPGAEISVSGGVHVLAIFDVTATTEQITALLGAAGYTGTFGRSDDVTTKTCPEVVTEIVRRGGIAIPAHVDGSNGLFVKLSGTTLKQAIDCADIFAMEVIDSSWSRPPIYSENGKTWTEVLGSDSHHPSGQTGQRYPGSGFTWVKMSKPNLEGLRLSLLDGSLSVRRFGAISQDPNLHGSMVIEQLYVAEAQYIGRSGNGDGSRGFRVGLNPSLNAVIGGRGTGKSTVVEFLRTALGRQGELPATLSRDFEKYQKVCGNRTDDGLLTAKSRLEVIYRKDGARYKVCWVGQGVSQIEVDDGAGNWTAEQGDITQRFPLRVYSQKQIFELAKDPLSLLRIVDEAAEVNRAKWNEEWRTEENMFLSFRADARRREAELGDEGRLKGELEDLKRKLEAFEGTDHAVVLKEYQRRQRESGVVEKWQSTWLSVSSRIRETGKGIAPQPIERGAFEHADAPAQDLLKISDDFVSTLGEIQKRMEMLASEVDDLSRQWTEKRDASRWKTEVNAAANAYRELKDKLKEQGAGDPSVYGDLVRQRQAVENRLADILSRREELTDIYKQADHCVGRLLSLRQELTRRRKEFIEKVLAQNPYVRIHVVPYGGRDGAEPDLRRILQREAGGFEKDIGTPGDPETLLGKLYQGNSEPQHFEARLKDMKACVRSLVSGKYHQTDVKDQRFAAHVTKLPPEALDRLETWFPEDSLQVEYSTAGDGSSFRSLQEGSPGQKTAALLAFLLSYGDEPIVLDQPEDDLDNHLIYNLIVKQLRTIKQSRQVLVVTHNANIVVNGDAELVVALAARGGQTQIEAQGSLQEEGVRDTICNIMEGGREAFERRYRRISAERAARTSFPVIQSAGG